MLQTALELVSLEDIHDGTDACGVCLLDFETDDEIKKTRCEHYFHAECIGKWLSECNTTCPTCQAEVE